jgi:uncharacterized protein
MDQLNSAVNPNSGSSLDLQQRDWKAFRYAHGSYLLHVPTGHIFSVADEHVQALLTTSELGEFLNELTNGLPKAPEKELEPIDITSIALNVEQSCNMRCVYCYAGDGDYGKDSSMSLSKAQEIVSGLAAGKPYFHIHFFGGEPLLNFSLIRALVTWCEALGTTKFRYSITTNGLLIRETVMQFLKDYRFSMTLSYDGKAIQESQRKNKDETGGKTDRVREKIVKYLDDLKKLPSFKIRSTIAREEIGNFASALEDSLKTFGAKVGFSPAFIDKHGQQYSDRNTDELALSLGLVVEKLIAAEDFDTILQISTIRSFIDLLHRGRINVNACAAGINYLSVSTDGTYYLCHRFTEDSSARVGDYKTGIDHTRLERIRQHRLGGLEPCRSCWMRKWCGGGCFHDNKVANGDELVIDRRFCHLQDMEINLAMKVYTQLLIKRPELLAP